MLFSLSFNFTLSSSVTTKSNIRQVLFFLFFFSFFFFFVNYHEVWLTDRDEVIRYYLKIPEEFVRLNLQDGLTLCIYHFYYYYYNYLLLGSFSNQF